ncbi:hypothetical protein FB45DRAFT_944413 [Roridomyces roridus]|uniref:Cyanovirin-N domain-containing protein n=1 Tax=Roridomyces roridus TaxID=1738132 RepID=A0AAD7B3Z0_9AGAR|nr:hypothetical protein FB45DRAFT_944413 [Roridomyces roridus]
MNRQNNPRARTPGPGPGIAQPQPRPPSTGFPAGFPQFNNANGNATFNATNGGGAAQGYQAESRRYERKESFARETHSSASRSAEAKERFDQAHRALEEYRNSPVQTLTLADCNLTLQANSLLKIVPRSSSITLEDDTLDLDDYIGELGGELTWGTETRFSDKCENIRLEGTIIYATCPRGPDERVQSSLDLAEHLVFKGRRFEPVLPDDAFTELMASAAWMNFTLISRPDMGGFLRHPAFQSAISRVAQSAVEKAMEEMKSAMALAVEEAVAMVALKSEEYVRAEMESLLMLATNAAAYAGLANMTMMQANQRRAYNVFAPHIASPLIPEDIRPGSRPSK